MSQDAAGNGTSEGSKEKENAEAEDRKPNLNVVDNRGKDKPEEPAIDVGAPMVVSDEQIARFIDCDNELVAVKNTFALAQQNATDRALDIKAKQVEVWKELADQYGFSVKDPYSVNYDEKVIIPGPTKVKK